MINFFTPLFLSILVVFTSCNVLGSGDGPPRTIVFSAQDDGEDPTFQIFSMREDGSGVRQLTSHERFSVQPSWSPDGTQIAFATFREVPQGATTLWVMEADGSNQCPLVHNPQTGNQQFGSNPSWSPDGTKLAFDFCVDCELGGSDREIFIADLQTGTIDTLAPHPASDSHPAWSPDGSRIAFGSRRDYFDADTLRFRQDLYMINIDGTDLQRLTQTGNAARPAWSPNENEIAYEWGRGGNNVFLYIISVSEIIDIDTGLQFWEIPCGTKMGQNYW